MCTHARVVPTKLIATVAAHLLWPPVRQGAASGTVRLRHPLLVPLLLPAHGRRGQRWWRVYIVYKNIPKLPALKLRPKDCSRRA